MITKRYKSTTKMHETTTKDIHNHHKETQKQLQNYTHAHRPQTREKDGCTEWHNCEPTPHRLRTLTGWNQRIRIDHKDTHTKPQRDYKQTAKLNRHKILKGSKKMNTNRRGNIWFVSPEVLALMSEGFKCVCRSIVRSSTHQLTQRSLINTLFYTLCL